MSSLFPTSWPTQAPWATAIVAALLLLACGEPEDPLAVPGSGSKDASAPLSRDGARDASAPAGRDGNDGSSTPQDAGGADRAMSGADGTADDQGPVQADAESPDVPPGPPDATPRDASPAAPDAQSADAAPEDASAACSPSEANVCGGCLPLGDPSCGTKRPGDDCSPIGGCARCSCTDPDTITCAPDPHAAELGTSCSTCGGLWSCGEGIARCEGDHTNACGGCDPLAGQPGSRCGTCGTWQCDGAGGVRCTGDVVNGCGGCTSLLGTPGSPCGRCGSYICSSLDSLTCYSDNLNACGGCSTLSALPGTRCGTCGSVQCAGTDAIACTNDTPNACGGCSTLSRQPGEACGACGSYQCAGPNALSCTGDTPNACGGCSVLSSQPGTSCGTCREYSCNGANAVSCQDVGTSGVIEVRNYTNVVEPWQNTEVVIYNGAYVVSKPTDASGRAEFDNVPCGIRLAAEAYNAGLSRVTNDFWVAKSFTTSASSFSTTLRREEPYGVALHAYRNSDNQEVTGGRIAAGTALRLELTVKNDAARSYDVRTRILWRAGTSSGTLADQTLAVSGAGGQRVYIWSWTPALPGTPYEAAVDVENLSIHPPDAVHTDSWPWGPLVTTN